LTIDHEAARSANAFPAVVIKFNGNFAVLNQTLVHDVQHLQERHIFTDPGCGISFEMAVIVRAILPPNLERQV
jgi:hypothetical protein